jgi:CHAD domain-containing protein
VSSSRAYKLERKESLPEGVARIARGRIDDAIDELSGEAGSSPQEAVHNARKDMKKLRALLRLVRGELGDDVYRRENECFRDAAAELSGVRDADVMLATLEGLELEEAVSGPLRQALEAHRVRTGGGSRGQAASLAIAILTEARARVDDWPLEHDDFDALRPGLTRMYKRGRRELHAARGEPSVEGLHEWRKRTKELWYDHTLLRFVWKPVMDAVGDEAHTLSDLLGDDHDLAVLLAWAQEHTEPEPELVEVVEARRAALQQEAVELGARLYTDRPKVFVRRLELLWEASREQAAQSPVKTSSAS